MANLITLLICLILVVQGQGYTNLLIQDGGRQPYEMIDTLTRADVCTAGEFFCDADCGKVNYCQDGQSSIVIETCDPPTTVCNATSHKCQAGIECIAPPSQDFKCRDVGYFPDPYDCKIYHLCGPSPDFDEILTGECADTSAYNPLTTQCSLTDQDRVCLDKPIPLCTSSGQIGPQIENPNIYYICIKEGKSFVPYLYKCPNSQIFVGTKCVSTTSTTVTTASSTVSTVPTSTDTSTTSSSTGTAETSTTEIIPTTSDATSTTTIGTPTTTEPPTTTPFPCPGPGMYPDPLDCHSFYLCNTNLVPKHYNCLKDYHFSKPSVTCIQGPCTN